MTGTYWQRTVQAKRHLAAQLRTLALGMSLVADQEELMRQAAELEAEADAIEATYPDGPPPKTTSEI